MSLLSLTQCQVICCDLYEYLDMSLYVYTIGRTLSLTVTMMNVSRIHLLSPGPSLHHRNLRLFPVGWTETKLSNISQTICILMGFME